LISIRQAKHGLVSLTKFSNFNWKYFLELVR